MLSGAVWLQISRRLSLYRDHVKRTDSRSHTNVTRSPHVHFGHAHLATVAVAADPYSGFITRVKRKP